MAGIISSSNQSGLVKTGLRRSPIQIEAEFCSESGLEVLLQVVQRIVLLRQLQKFKCLYL